MEYLTKYYRAFIHPFSCYEVYNLEVKINGDAQDIITHITGILLI